MSRQLYEVVAGPLPTTLTSPFLYGRDTSILIEDATDIPDAPNIITLSDVDDFFITLEYLTKNDTELTDLTFIEGFSSREFSIGSEVVRAVAKYDFDAIKEAIDSAQSFDIVVDGQVLPKIDSKVTIPASSQGHLGLVKPGQNITVDSDGTINASSQITLDYNLLSNKPKIEGNELIGNKTASELGLASIEDLNGKVDKETGKGLSTNDFTDAYKNKIDSSASDLADHIADTNNPHSVTKSQVGLGNADNTSDLNKPISTATQNALNLKADDSDLQTHIEDMDNPHEVTKSQVGLSNVDNTSDLGKPISTLTQAALDEKADSSDVDTLGETLSNHIDDTDNPHSVTKTQIGLGNVDNTADLNKPISNAVQNALDGKASTTHADTHSTGGDDEITPSDIGAAQTNHRSVTDTYGASSNAYYGHSKASSTIPKALASTPNTGVELDSFARGDHVHPLPAVASDSANGLMSSTDKSKLDGIDSGAEVNVLEGVQINSVDLAITNKKVNIPIASASTLGLFKVGANLSMNTDGTLSAVVEGAAQSDWSETNPLSPAFIKEKPTLGTASALDVSASGNAGTGQVVKGNDTRLTDSRAPITHASTHYGSGADAIPNATQTTNGLMSSADKVKLNGIEEQAQKNVKSDWDATTGDAQILGKPTALSDFSNDENFQTDTEVAASITTHNSSTTAHTDIRQSVSSEVSRAEGEEQSLQNQIDALASKTDVADVVATYADLDISKYLVNDIVKVMQDSTHGGAISYYKVKEAGGVKSWEYVGSQGPFYTKSEADNYFVPQQRTINGQSLANNVTLDADDVNALPDNTTLADLTDDATHRLVTDTQISSWNSKQAALTFDTAPTSGSTNPVTSGGVYTALSSKASSSDLQSHIEDTDNPHGVTKSQVGLGNVNNTSDLDKPISTAVQSALDEKVDAVEGKGLSTNDFTTALKNKLDGVESGAQVNVQANWNATTAATGAVANKPTKLSDFTNDSGFQTSTQVSSTVNTAVSSHNSNTSAHSDIRTLIGNLSSALDGKVDVEQGKGLSTNDFTTSLKTKLDGIEAGAEVNVQSDWTQTDSTADDYINGKPTKLSDFTNDSGFQTSSQVASAISTHNSSSSAHSDIRTALNGKASTTHASTHASAGSDPITPSAIGAEPAFTKGTAFNKNFGTASGTVCQGNDSRLNNARTPTAHASTHATGGTDAITPSAIGAEPAFTKNGAFNKNFGATAGTVCEGNDARLSDARTPTSHASTATTYGVASASNYGHPKASTATPAALASSASVGTDDGTYARGNHAHRNPIIISTADASGGSNGDVWLKYIP